MLLNIIKRTDPVLNADWSMQYFCAEIIHFINTAILCFVSKAADVIQAASFQKSIAIILQSDKNKLQ